MVPFEFMICFDQTLSNLSPKCKLDKLPYPFRNDKNKAEYRVCRLVEIDNLMFTSFLISENSKIEFTFLPSMYYIVS